MVVGDGGDVVNGSLLGGMTKDENRVHFGGWCIVSSPLILAYNLSTPARREHVWDIITNKEAIQVNQAWAGHPGAQVLANIGSNNETEVWAKPLGGNRTAVFVVNTAVYNHTSIKDENGQMMMEPCNASSPSQDWTLSPGIHPGDGGVTNIKSTTGNKGCWEITGCNMHANAAVGTGFGCKALPKGPCSGNMCDCNGAWTINSNGSITSYMSHLCMVAEGSKVTVSVCDGSAAQQWKVVSSTLDPTAVRIVQGAKCVDSNQQPQPPGPQPGPGGPSDVSFVLTALNLGFEGAVRVRDLWNHKDLSPLPSTSSSFSTHIPYHGSAFLVFMPGDDSEWPLPFELAPWMRSKPTPPM